MTDGEAAALTERVDALEASLAAAREELALKDQLIAALKKRLFGRSSERLDPAQLQMLFGEEVLGLLGRGAAPPSRSDAAEPERSGG